MPEYDQHQGEEHRREAEKQSILYQKLAKKGRLKMDLGSGHQSPGKSISGKTQPNTRSVRWEIEDFQKNPHYKH
jgi:hypothetical protein